VQARPMLASIPIAALIRLWRLDADDSPRNFLIRGFTASLLFFRDGSNDQLAYAAFRQRPFRLRDGRNDKFLNFWTSQRGHGLDPDKTVLAAVAEKQLTHRQLGARRRMQCP
jgi:hypothetical protein